MGTQSLTRAPPWVAPSWDQPRASSPSLGTTWSTTSRPTTRDLEWSWPEPVVSTTKNFATWPTSILAKLEPLTTLRSPLRAPAGTLDLMSGYATTTCLLHTSPSPPPESHPEDLARDVVSPRPREAPAAPA